MRLNDGWTEEQLKYMIEHYPYERAKDISEIIGKTQSCVEHKANRLGLKKDKDALFRIKSEARKGDKTWNYKGYRRRTPKGYIVLYRPDHPMADKSGLIMEHRVVMEEALGCYLPKGMAVHHINGIKDDNRIENLAVMTHSAHSALHNKRDKKYKRGKENPLYKEFDTDAAKEMRTQGYTIKAICEHFGISKSKYWKEMREAS